MSYILDALKKSEGEREQTGELPDWQTDHSGYSVPSAPTKQQIYTISIMSAILVSMLLGLLIWWLDSRGLMNDRHGVQGDIEMQDDSMSAGRAESGKGPKPVEQAAEVTAEIPKPTKSKGHTKTTFEKFNQVQQAALAKPKAKTAPTKTETAVEKPDSEKKSKGSVVFSDTRLDLKRDDKAKPTKKVVDVAELPADVRAKMPAISFAGHVYSSEAKQRSVMVNGRKTREGQTVDRDLTLEKITTDGAVFNYKGWRFRLGALQDWSNSGAVNNP